MSSDPHINLENEKKNDKEDDLILTTSQHDIGENLSKYDHFLSREDIMSPLKQANPSKLIYDTIPNILLDQFVALTEIFEKNGFLKVYLSDKETDEWEMFYQEEFVEKTFKAFMSKKVKSRGKIVINFNDKTAHEIFAVN